MHSFLKKYLGLILAFAGFPALVSAQYTQGIFWNSDLRLNPALTGLMQSKWRVSEHYRNQSTDINRLRWNTLSADFRKEFTKTAGDYGLKMEESTGRSLGIGFYDDRVNYGNDSSRYISDYFSLAYHRVLKKGGIISLGVQPGYMRTELEKYFDLNAGIAYGQGSYDCWREDQYTKVQFGISGYHLTRDFSDSALIPGREINIHYGQLIKGKKNFNFIVNAEYSYRGIHEFIVGTYVLFFPVVHYRYFDRGRLGIHYRTTNHLLLSAGARLYGRGGKSITVDGIIGYEMPMKFLDFESPYNSAWEIGIVISPFKKCWSLSPCGN